MAEESQTPSFEAGLTELETVVKELEAGDLPLERALALFEKGTALSAACRKQLDDAELDAIIQGVIDELGVSGMQAMGQVIAKVKERTAGSADGGRIAAKVKGKL